MGRKHRRIVGGSHKKPECPNGHGRQWTVKRWSSHYVRGKPCDVWVKMTCGCILTNSDQPLPPAIRNSKHGKTPYANTHIGLRLGRKLKLHPPRKKGRELFDTVFSIIATWLAQGRKVKIARLGTFSLRPSSRKCNNGMMRVWFKREKSRSEWRDNKGKPTTVTGQRFKENKFWERSSRNKPRPHLAGLDERQRKLLRQAVKSAAKRAYEGEICTKI